MDNGDIMACGFVVNNNKWDPLLIRTDADGCIDQGQTNCPQVQIIDLMSGAVDEIGEPSISINPNPTSQQFSLHNLPASDVQVHLYDMSGRLVKNFHNSNDGRFDISELNSGIYIVRAVQSGATLYNGKLSVVH